jgi:hypothetical protein
MPFLAVLILLAAAATARADDFSAIEHSPYTYWVPPGAGYAAGTYYGGPPPVYYYGPPPPPPVPSFFIHFHIR